MDYPCDKFASLVIVVSAVLARLANGMANPSVCLSSATCVHPIQRA